MKAIIGGNLAQAFPAKPENVSALLDRIMALFRGVNHEIAGNRPHARTDYSCVSVVARAFQRDQVCFRPTTRQRAETQGPITNQLTEPANDARLDDRRCWTVAPSARVLIQGGAKGVGPDADRQRRRIELAIVARARN